MNKLIPYALAAIGAVLVLRWMGVPLPAFITRVTGPATTIGFFVAAWPQMRKVLG